MLWMERSGGRCMEREPARSRSAPFTPSSALPLSPCGKPLHAALMPRCHEALEFRIAAESVEHRVESQRGGGRAPGETAHAAEHGNRVRPTPDDRVRECQPAL